MPLFMCEKCGCIENTATGAYWGRDKKICSECETGKWHGIFKKKSAVGMFIDQNNHLWNKLQVDSDVLPKHCRIVGIVDCDCNLDTTET